MLVFRRLFHQRGMLCEIHLVYTLGFTVGKPFHPGSVAGGANVPLPIRATLQRQSHSEHPALAGQISSFHSSCWHDREGGEPEAAASSESTQRGAVPSPRAGLERRLLGKRGLAAAASSRRSAWSEGTPHPTLRLPPFVCRGSRGFSGSL